MAVVAVVLCLALWNIFVAWPLYAEEHHCSRTGASRHSTHTRCNLVGKITVCQPYTVTHYEWLCDGGERVWR
jgi:hypothetical protein